jgi:hypothetical protein
MNEMQTAVVVHNCNPHTWEAKGGASWWHKGQSGPQGLELNIKQIENGIQCKPNLSSTMVSRQNHQCVHREDESIHTKIYMNRPIHTHVQRIGIWELSGARLDVACGIWVSERYMEGVGASLAQG